MALNPNLPEHIRLLLIIVPALFRLLEPCLDNRSLPGQCTRCPQISAKRSSLTQLSRGYGRALRH